MPRIHTISYDKINSDLTGDAQCMWLMRNAINTLDTVELNIINR